MEIQRGSGFLKDKLLEEKYEAKLEFSGVRGAKQKAFHGGGGGGGNGYFLELHSITEYKKYQFAIYVHVPARDMAVIAEGLSCDFIVMSWGNRKENL